MYGLMFNILRETVIGEYGPHYWKEICEKSRMLEMEGEMVAKHRYNDEQMTSLLSTAASVLGVEVVPILELCGEQFFRKIKHSGHYKVVSCLGHTLEGFLLNLDTLHDHLTLAYPKMKPLSFRAETTQSGLLLHYYSTRKGLYPMVIGMVRMIAKEFYKLQVDIQLEEEVVDQGSPLPYHYKLAIEMIEGRKDRGAIGRLRGNSVVPEILSLPPSRTSFNDPIPNLSPDSPLPLPPQFNLSRGKEERSQSTGQIMRERSGGHSFPVGLTPSVIADLSRLCPALPDVQEEEEKEDEVEGKGGEEEPDMGDMDITPLVPRRPSPCVSSSPQGSPLPRRVIPLSDSDEAVASLLRRGSSHSSLILPPSLLPTLTTSTSKLSLTASRADSAMGMDHGWPITKSLFQMCFPFHIIFDPMLTIHYMGASMSRLLPNAIAKEEKLTDHFNLLRPIGTFNYQTIRSSIHNPFILALKPSPDNLDKKTLQFRGQMVPVINSENCSVLFIGSPRIETVEDLQLKGLYLTDLPIHDVTRELILMSHHFKAEVNVAFQLEVTKRELETEKRRVQEEKQRADNLLHAMLPPSVAVELTTTTGDGCNQVVAEEVEMVTILFSDIKDFTTICHRCNPMEVVSMLNELYTKFDSSIDKHKVYKVETIGDAYMVAAGLLDTSSQHAEAVTNMAFDMRRAAAQVTTPHTNESIQIRIGIHTGHVVAGVVGTKMPRYCLFGDTVNTASRMESHGAAGRIHISQMTYKRLCGRPYVFWNRGKIRIKGLPELQQTYFVEPGEEHELNEAMTIRVELDNKIEDSDSDWEEAQVDSNAFVRQKRLPSFVRYKDIRVIHDDPPSPIYSPDVSLASLNSTSSSLLRLPGIRRPRRTSVTTPRKRSISPRLAHPPTMKERLARKLSLGSRGSFSLSQGLSSFLEHEEGHYREMGIDLPPHTQLTVDTASENSRKLSNSSVGMFIKVEPEGKSVTFTKERISVSSSTTQDDEEEEEEEEEEEGTRAAMGSKSESDFQAAVKSKKHRRKHRANKNKCKVS